MQEGRMSWLERLEPQYVLNMLGGLALVVVGIAWAPAELQELTVGGGLVLMGTGGRARKDE
jgi:hypothetical protein